MLDLGDLINLIRLTELEIVSLNKDINGDDEQARNDAGEVLIQFDALSSKLKNMYEQIYSDDSGYPLYSDFIAQLHNRKN